MKIKVCDAMCGQGKTMACINMMNSSFDKKFIFVTPFLSEVERIKTGCHSRNFVSPEDDKKKGKTKLADVSKLIAAGENIATTHSLFSSYTDQILQMIRENKYILVLDEVVDVFEFSDVTDGDVNLLKRSSMLLEDENGQFTWNDKYDQYDGRFSDEMLMARSKNFLKYDEEHFFWSIHPELFSAFEDAYILTYMFNAQPLRCFFDVHKIEYELIGVTKKEGIYTFCEASEMDRCIDLRDKIHIVNIGKVNNIGGNRNALSYSWYQKARKEKDMPALITLRNNMSNIFSNVMRARSSEIMWTTFKEHEAILRAGGRTYGFVPYNKRASNELSNRKYLAYCVNNFPRPMENKYYKDKGVSLDSDMYALSILIQWVFRSAIRKGEEIWLYLPSVRMRNLLVRWLDNLAEGKDLDEVSYRTPRKSYATGAKRGRPPKCGRKKRGRPIGSKNKPKTTITNNEGDNQ